jgi:hypothetical protein
MSDIEFLIRASIATFFAMANAVLLLWWAAMFIRSTL